MQQQRAWCPLHLFFGRVFVRTLTTRFMTKSHFIVRYSLRQPFRKVDCFCCNNSKLVPGRVEARGIAKMGWSVRTEVVFIPSAVTADAFAKNARWLQLHSCQTMAAAFFAIPRSTIPIVLLLLCPISRVTNHHRSILFEQRSHSMNHFICCSRKNSCTALSNQYIACESFWFPKGYRRRRRFGP